MLQIGTEGDSDAKYVTSKTCGWIAIEWSIKRYRHCLGTQFQAPQGKVLVLGKVLVFARMSAGESSCELIVIACAY